MMSLRCYMLELVMVIEEEDIWDNYTKCISDFSDTLPKLVSGDSEIQIKFVKEMFLYLLNIIP